MFVYNERAKKYVRLVTGKPIRSGKNKGTMRSNVQATDIEFKFKSRIGVSSIYHKWA